MDRTVDLAALSMNKYSILGRKVTDFGADSDIENLLADAGVECGTVLAHNEVLPILLDVDRPPDASRASLPGPRKYHPTTLDCSTA